MSLILVERPQRQTRYRSAPPMVNATQVIGSRALVVIPASGTRICASSRRSLDEDVPGSDSLLWLACRPFTDNIKIKE